ncbi:MAG: hypothetical protein VX776_06045, partial [Planctomycetota bacterium]|nr:hypothetical protein [Planctomycetota bacterium]
FGTSAANNSPNYDVLLFGTEEPVENAGIDYRAAQLLILEGAEGEGWLNDEEAIGAITSGRTTDLNSIDRFFEDY